MAFAASAYDGWLDRHIGKVDPGMGVRQTVVELGCGYGDDTSYLADTGHHIIACDRSKEALLAVRQQYAGVDIRLFDLRGRFPFPTGMADVVVASLCLHFFDEGDTLAILAEIRRILKDDGLFLCRLNSDRSRVKDVPGEIEIEPGLLLTREGVKRFYTEEMVRRTFGAWHIARMEHYETMKFAKMKALIELVLRPRGGDQPCANDTP